VARDFPVGPLAATLGVQTRATAARTRFRQLRRRLRGTSA